MKTVLLVFGILFCIHLAEAAMLGFGPDPLRKLGGCYHGWDDIGHMTEGETRYLSPHECARVTCNRGGSVTYIGCAKVSTEDPKCKIIPGDKFKPNPGCCPDVTCRL